MPVIPATILVVVVGGYFLFRRTDVRLVLILAAGALFLVRATQPEVAGARWDAFSQFFAEFARGMVNPSSVIPICSAMGFAYVCKLTGCDAHLVHLLCVPLRHVRWLLIPGGIAVAFFVNSAIVSQTSTVSVVGPVLIPLLVGAGISRQTAGALLLLGGSMGGELLNPAAIEVRTTAELTGADYNGVIGHLLPYNMLASGTALLVFWFMALRYERRLATASPDQLALQEDAQFAVAPGSIAATMASGADAANIERVNLFKAIVPLIPIILLVVVKRWIRLPDVYWPVGTKSVITEQATIGAAMLVGVACAAISSPRRTSHIASAFFEGAGFIYSHVISVITAATMFAEAISANGIIRMVAPSVEHAPHVLTAASVIVPWVMATVTGTAVGTAPLVLKILVPIALGPSSNHADGLRIGSVNSIAAQFGRTSSPVAPVVIMCATLARSRPLTLVKRIVIPLIAGGVVLFIAALTHH